MIKQYLAGFGVVVLTTSLAQAATATSSFMSKLLISASCTVTATDLDFGTAGLFTANIDQTSVISVTCTNTTPYNVGLNVGAYGSSVTARKMKVSAASSDAIAYSMFRDAARSQNWGNSVGSDTFAGTGTGLIQPLIIYGRVPIQNAVTSGSYNDTIAVTVTY